MQIKIQIIGFIQIIVNSILLALEIRYTIFSILEYIDNILGRIKINIIDCWHFNSKHGFVFSFKYTTKVRNIVTFSCYDLTLKFFRIFYILFLNVGQKESLQSTTQFKTNEV